MNGETANTEASQSLAGSMRRLILAGCAGLALFASTVGVWAVMATLSGAVIAGGQFVVDGNVKKVQHASGGIVGELNVREGDRVEQGQVVIRLDDTVTRANFQVVTKQLDELTTRQGRLQAERDGKEQVAFAAELTARRDEPGIAELIATEQSLFEARRAARDGQKAQLAQRIDQLNDEITGLKAQQKARDQQAQLIEEELTGIRWLYAKNLVALNRRAALEREAARLEGQKGQLIAALAQAEGKIVETRLQIIQIDATLREEVMKELREIQGKSAELVERRIAAEDQMKRIEIRSPSSGFVHQLAVHTVGGVITPAEPAMLIVPADDALQVEGRVNPPDIDQIALGQEARVRIHAFNQRVTPELTGRISRISADISRDQQTGVSFYTIRVTIPAAEYARLGQNHVSAGMQAEVFVRTEDRTPLEYIVKPLKDQITRAFRER